MESWVSFMYHWLVYAEELLVTLLTSNSPRIKVVHRAEGSCAKVLEAMRALMWVMEWL